MIQDPIKTLREDLAALRLRPNRLYGQNFLIDTQKRDRCYNLLEVSPSESVIEIGPGTGILTYRLALSGVHSTCVEKDPRLFELLSERFVEFKNVQIVHGDALEYISGKFPALSDKSVKIISNLPYSISSPVLMESCRFFRKILCGVLTVQKEVAERVLAPGGTRQRGVLSVAIQSRFAVRKEMDLKPACFFPRPEVDSSTIMLAPHHIQPHLDWDQWMGFIKLCFARKRKTIFNNLRIRYPANMVDSILKRCDIEMQQRAESISLEGLSRLFSHFSEVDGSDERS